MKPVILPLLYHHVAPTKIIKERPDQKLFVSTENFYQQILWLNKNFDIISLEQLVFEVNTSYLRKKPAVLITFDDGHSDNLHHALPICKGFDTPLCIYLCTRWMSEKPWLWRHDIVDLIQSVPEIQLTINNKKYHHTIDPADLSQAYQWCAAFFVKVHPDQQYSFLNSLLKNHQREIKIRNDEFLNWDQIARMNSEPLVTFGAHTLSHAMLSRLSPDEVHHEMMGSKLEIEKHLKQPILHFASPYGGANASGKRESQIAKDVGFKTLITTIPGTCSGESSPDTLLELPRLSIQGQWEIDHFKQQVQEYLN